MRILPFLVLVLSLAGCATRRAEPTVVAPQPVGEAVCARPTYIGAGLVLNGHLWTTESDEEMREWLSRIDSADIERREEFGPTEAAAIYGTRAARGVVVVELKRGSPSEHRFTVPPAPYVQRLYCHRIPGEPRPAPPPR
jgi:hypothetical protein